MFLIEMTSEFSLTALVFFKQVRKVRGRYAELTYPTRTYKYY